MGKHDLSDAAWDAWVDDVAQALGLDGAAVDVPFIHGLTQVVAHEFTRPMAPVAAYLLGLAAGRHPERSVEELRDAIVGVVRG